MKAHGPAGSDAPFDLGVVAVQGVEELDLVGAGDPSQVPDVRRGDGVPPAGLLLMSDHLVLLIPARLVSADDCLDALLFVFGAWTPDRRPDRHRDVAGRQAGRVRLCLIRRTPPEPPDSSYPGGWQSRPKPTRERLRWAC